MNSKPAKHPGPETPYGELSDRQRQDHMDRILETRPHAGSPWIFGYGSLMWNPCFSYTRREAAELEGCQRAFHIWTANARGTPEKPGLGLCLEPSAGRCRGLAFQMAAETETLDLAAIWAREMITGIYRPEWRNVVLDGGEQVTALVFIVNRDHRQYAGPLPPDTMARVIASARGKYGPCRDYLASTVEEMQKLGVRDRDMEELLQRVQSVTDAGEIS